MDKLSIETHGGHKLDTYNLKITMGDTNFTITPSQDGAGIIIRKFNFKNMSDRLIIIPEAGNSITLG
jgi:hypothetical protein